MPSVVIEYHGGPLDGKLETTRLDEGYFGEILDCVVTHRGRKHDYESRESLNAETGMIAVYHTKIHPLSQEKPRKRRRPES